MHLKWSSNRVIKANYNVKEKEHSEKSRLRNQNLPPSSTPVHTYQAVESTSPQPHMIMHLQ